MRFLVCWSPGDYCLDIVWVDSLPPSNFRVVIEFSCGFFAAFASMLVRSFSSSSSSHCTVVSRYRLRGRWPKVHQVSVLSGWLCRLYFNRCHLLASLSSPSGERLHQSRLGRGVEYWRTVDLGTSLLVRCAPFHCFSFIVSRIIIVVEMFCLAVV